MSEYNINNNNLYFNEDSSSDEEKKTKYLLAFFAGLGVSIIVAIIMALLGIWLESECILVLALGAVIVSVTIHHFVPQNSKIGAVTGAVLCPVTYFLYQFIMAMFGYYYEDGGNTFGWMLIGSVVFVAWMGYNDGSEN